MPTKHSSDRATSILEDAEEDVKPQRTGFVKCLCDNMFMITVIIGVAIGFGIGFGLRAVPHISEDLIIWISMPGDIYIRLLKLTILPLIGANIIIVIAKLDPKENGKISLVAFVYIVLANIAGAAVGTAASAAIQPGNINEQPQPVVPNKIPKKNPTTSDVFADLLLNIFPDNIVGVAIYSMVTQYVPQMNGTQYTGEFDRVGTQDDGTNMIGVIFVAVVFGLSASAAKERGVPFLDFFGSLAEVVLKLIRAFLLATPVGVCFQIAGAVLKVDDIVGTFAKLAIFIATVIVGVAVMSIILFLLFFIVTRRNPFYPIPYMLKAWFLSFATTSAIVSVPEIYQGCDDLKIRKATSRFVAPLAATLKADGSAVFISAASVFVCQLEGLGGEAGKIVVIWLLTSSLAIAIPHIPSSSIVIIYTILSSVSCPVEQVGLLFAVEWLLDRIRTGFSTLSTCYCVVLTECMTVGKDGAEDDDDNENSDFDDDDDDDDGSKSSKSSKA